jgi:hypothetical protein
VTTDATSFSMENAVDAVDLVYSGVTAMRMEIQPAP